MLKIVFFGSSNFSSIILERIKKTDICPFLIITTDNSLIKKRTKIPVKIYPCEIEKSDLFVVASFGKILPKKILEIPFYGALNVHPSLLPKHRGASPIQGAILNNDKKTGTTIILMDEIIDHGKIIAQQEYKMKRKETFSSLEKRLAEISADLLIKTVPLWIKKEIKEKKQEEKETSYTKLLTKEDGRIDWHEEASLIERKVRALNPWPGTFTFWKKNDKNIRIKILEAEEEKKDFSLIPGKVGSNFIIQTGKGSLRPTKIQLEGKKPVLIEDFLKGNKIYEDILF